MTLSASYIATPVGGNKWHFERLYEWISHSTNSYRTLMQSGMKLVTVIMRESLHHSLNGLVQKHKLIQKQIKWLLIKSFNYLYSNINFYSAVQKLRFIQEQNK